MESKDTNGMPVSLVILENGSNLTFSGTLVLSATNGTEVKPTEVPYDAKGAGLFTVVVISVYCFSIVLFIASFIKRKTGVSVEEEEKNTVTHYLTQVPDLKEKTAREHFRKMKMGIIEKVEKGAESDREAAKSSLSNKLREKRTKGHGDLRQPLLGDESTRCMGSSVPNNMETCSKLVQALHSIQEVEEVTDCSEPYTPNTNLSYDPLGSTSEQAYSDPSTPWYTPDKYYKFFTFTRQSSEETSSSVTKDVNWEEDWLNLSRNGNETACNTSGVPLVPLPPPPAFQQGYRAGPKCRSNVTYGDVELVEFPSPFVQSSGHHDQVTIEVEDTKSTESTPQSPRTFRGKRWPPSPSLGQAARARLAPRSQHSRDVDWDDDQPAGDNGLTVNVLEPWDSGNKETHEKRAKETHVLLDANFKRQSAMSSL